METNIPMVLLSTHSSSVVPLPTNPPSRAPSVGYRSYPPSPAASCPPTPQASVQPELMMPEGPPMMPEGQPMSKSGTSVNSRTNTNPEPITDGIFQNEFHCDYREKGCPFSGSYKESVQVHKMKCPFYLLGPFMDRMEAKTADLEKRLHSKDQAIRVFEQDFRMLKQESRQEIAKLKAQLSEKNVQIELLNEAFGSMEATPPTLEEIDIKSVDNPEKQMQIFLKLHADLQQLALIVDEILVKKADRGYCDKLIKNIDSRMRCTVEEVTMKLMNPFTEQLNTEIGKKVEQPAVDALVEEERLMTNRIRQLEASCWSMKQGMVTREMFQDLNEKCHTALKESLNQFSVTRLRFDSVEHRQVQREKELADKLKALSRIKADKMEMVRVMELTEGLLFTDDGGVVRTQTGLTSADVNTGPNSITKRLQGGEEQQTQKSIKARISKRSKTFLSKNTSKYMDPLNPKTTFWGNSSPQSTKQDIRPLALGEINVATMPNLRSYEDDTDTEMYTATNTPASTAMPHSKGRNQLLGSRMRVPQSPRSPSSEVRTNRMVAATPRRGQKKAHPLARDERFDDLHDMIPSDIKIIQVSETFDKKLKTKASISDVLDISRRVQLLGQNLEKTAHRLDLYSGGGAMQSSGIKTAGCVSCGSPIGPLGMMESTADRSPKWAKHQGQKTMRSSGPSHKVDFVKKAVSYQDRRREKMRKQIAKSAVQDDHPASRVREAVENLGLDDQIDTTLPAVHDPTPDTAAATAPYAAPWATGD